MGQNIIEKVTLVPPGANLGWNDWEGSFRYMIRTEVDTSDPRGDPEMTFPVVEYDQIDEILAPSSAVTGIVVCRSDRIPDLRGRVLFGDFPTATRTDLRFGEGPDGRVFLLNKQDGVIRELVSTP